MVFIQKVVHFHLIFQFHGVHVLIHNIYYNVYPKQYKCDTVFFQSNLNVYYFICYLSSSLNNKKLLNKQEDSPKGIKDISEIDCTESFILKSIIFKKNLFCKTHLQSSKFSRDE